MNEQLGRNKRTATQAAEGVPRWQWTTAELIRLIELGAIDPDERIELIGGEIVPMSPKGRLHEVLKEELAHHWTLLAPTGIAISVEQQLNLDEGTYTDPDILVRPGSISSYDLKGPELLLLVEIADTSWDKDIGIKARIYARAGVRDYWVIDATTRKCRVHREPQGEAYQSIIDVPADTAVTPLLVPELAVTLTALRR